MVLHILLPVNIHFHWNLFIFEFLTIVFNFYIGGHLENFKNERAQLWVMIYFCVRFQKDPLYGLNLTFFYTLVTMATAAILNLFNPQQLAHTTVDIPTKFHEVWWKESKAIFNPPFLYLW